MREQGIDIDAYVAENGKQEGGYYKWSATWCTPSVKRTRKSILKRQM